MAFNLNDYEPVAARLGRWLADCQTRQVRGRVLTELVHHGAGWCVFRADLYEDDLLVATGWAEEHATERGVNATSHVENCETSSVGRALANAGWAGSDPDRRPSQEEMRKVKAGDRAANRPVTPSAAPEPIPSTTTPEQPTGHRDTPTDKMVKFLRVLEKRKGVQADSAAEQDFDLCRSEIDRLQGLPDV